MKKLLLIAATFLAFPSCDKLGKQKHEVEVIDISDVTEETAQPKKKEKKSPLDCVLASQAVEKNGERVHFYRGYFTNNRKEFPIMIAFIERDGMVTMAHYKNIDYKAMMKMSVSVNGDYLNLVNLASNSDFNVNLIPEADCSSFTGMAYDGNTALRVYIEPTLDQFNF